MTFVASVIARDSIWLLTDRRLSRGGRAVRDDARKAIAIETHDGIALIGYAGLGATSKGTEPSDWMNAVLRTTNMPIEVALGQIADAARRQLPRHLRKPGARRHEIVAPAFVNDIPSLYTIELSVPNGSSDNNELQFHRQIDPRSGRPPRFGVAGSGAQRARNLGRAYWRHFHRCLNAHERGAVSDEFIADRLAELNERVLLATTDKSVGPRCIVVWRRRRESAAGGGCGGFRRYTSGTLEQSATTADAIPQLANGLDLRALSQAIAPTMLKRLELLVGGRSPEEVNAIEVDIDKVLRDLPNCPNERLD